MKSESLATTCCHLSVGRLLVGGMLTLCLPSGTARAAPGDLLLTIPRPETGGFFFGDKVATLPGRIVVGDPFANVGGEVHAGRAYLFDAKSGELIHEFTDPTPRQLDIFGEAVAADAGRILIGSSNSAFLFDAKSGELLHAIDRPGVPENARPGGGFGRAAALAGNSILVGAQFLTIDGVNVGGAYLFDAETAELIHFLPFPFADVSGSWFGSSVGFLGDDALVSTGWQVFTFDPVTGQEAQRFEYPDTLARFESPGFGDALAGRGDVIVVGASGAELPSGMRTGKAFAFNSRSGALVFRIDNPDPGWHERFGSAVSWVGDNILVAASRDEVEGQQGAGSVYLFDGQTGELLLTIPNPDPASYGFGESVAALDGNIVVGGQGTQKVYVFEGVPDIPVGDTDADGDVDIDDLNALRNNFGRVGEDDGSLAGDTWPYDGAVGIDDLNRVRNYFGTTRHPALPVPEPVGSVLLILGVVAIAPRRRKR